MRFALSPSWFVRVFMDRLILFRGEMLTKVRQFRETSARLNSELRTCQEAIQNVTKVGFDSSEQNNQNSQDEKYKQQVLQGASALEKTSQSLQRY